MGCVLGLSAKPAVQILRFELVELRPSQFSLRLRERAISKSDIIIGSMELDLGASVTELKFSSSSLREI